MILQIWISKHFNLKVFLFLLLSFPLLYRNQPILTIIFLKDQLSLKIMEFRCHQLLTLIWKRLLVYGLKIKLNPKTYSIWRKEWLLKIFQMFLWSKMDRINTHYLTLELFMKATILLRFIIITVVIIMTMDLKILSNSKMKSYLQIINLKMTIMETVKNSSFQDSLTKI